MNKHNIVDKIFVDKVLSSVRADNLSTGADKTDAALINYYFCKWKDRLEESCLSLRKYQSNSTSLNKWLTKKYRILTEEHNGQIENKILGIKWDKFEDSFFFFFNEIRGRFGVLPTKRNVIEAIGSLYDLLELLNPIVVHMKTFFSKVMFA